MIGRPGRRAEGDDVLRELSGQPGLRMNQALVWYMRALSAIWLVKGLLGWAYIIGVGTGPVAFAAAEPGYQAGIVYFAVVDLVAAVGLWLTSHWGGILWLLTVVSQLIVAIFFPRLVVDSTLVLTLLILGILCYLTIAWLASVEE